MRRDRLQQRRGIRKQLAPACCGHEPTSGAAQKPQAPKQPVKLVQKRDVRLSVRRPMNLGVPPALLALSGLAHERPVERPGLSQRDPLDTKLEQP